MKASIRWLLVFLTASVAFPAAAGVFAVSDATDINLEVSCNANGICEPGLNENGLNCPDDCPICNNNDVCEPVLGETVANCVRDCQICNNNGNCDAARGEDHSNCPTDCPLPPAAGVGGQPLLKPPVIDNIKISDIARNSAMVSWKTDKPALCRLSLGDTVDYRKGVIAQTAFGTQHSTKITGLVPQTTYHFRLECEDVYKRMAQTPDQIFSTLNLPDTVPPANVSDFGAEASGDRIALDWINPPDRDFAGVRIVRSQKFFPADPWSGAIIYDGAGGSFVDTDVTAAAYYYAAFSYDTSGNFASGALVSASLGEAPPPPISAPPPPEIEKIGFKDFDFMQKDKGVVNYENGTLSVDDIDPLTISIPYGQIPQVLKTIMVTLQKESKTFSFLLRANKEKTLYTASLLPPAPGNYPFYITILDYKNQALKKIEGQLSVVKAAVRGQARPLREEKIVPPAIYVLLTVIAALLAYIVVKLSRRLRKDKQRTYQERT